MFNPKVGDIVDEKNGDRCKVLVVLKDVFLPSRPNRFTEAAGAWYTFQEAERLGWRVEGKKYRCENINGAIYCDRMGMFDWIKYKAPCWKCGKEVTDFQSKDGGCTLATLTPEQLGSGSFYSACGNCEAWNEYDVTALGVKIELDEVSSKEIN